MKKRIAQYQVSLKVFLKNRKGQVLILKNPDRGSMANYFDLPGGRIDVDEVDFSLEKVIARELKDELGNVRYSLKPKPIAIGRHYAPVVPKLFKKSARYFLVFFEAKYLSGTIQISEEHVGYEWVKLEELPLQKYFHSGILEGVKMYLDKKIS